MTWQINLPLSLNNLSSFLFFPVSLASIHLPLKLLVLVHGVQKTPNKPMKLFWWYPPTPIKQNKPESTLMCSNSVSRAWDPSIPAVKMFFSKCHKYIPGVFNKVCKFSLCNVSNPAHTGLKGNEEADRFAKQALQRDVLDLQESLSKSEVKGIVWSKAAEEWKQCNTKISGKFLYTIQIVK